MLGLNDQREPGGVAWIRHAVMTALRPMIGIDAVSKYANHSSVIVTEAVYDLDREALDLKSLALGQARKIFAPASTADQPRDEPDGNASVDKVG